MNEQTIDVFDLDAMRKLARDHNKLRREFESLRGLLVDRHHPRPQPQPIIGKATGEDGVVTGTYKIAVQQGPFRNGADDDDGEHIAYVVEAKPWMSDAAPAEHDEVMLWQTPFGLWYFAQIAVPTLIGRIATAIGERSVTSVLSYQDVEIWEKNDSDVLVDTGTTVRAYNPSAIEMQADEYVLLKKVGAIWIVVELLGAIRDFLIGGRLMPLACALNTRIGYLTLSNGTPYATSLTLPIQVVGSTVNAVFTANRGGYYAWHFHAHIYDNGFAQPNDDKHYRNELTFGMCVNGAASGESCYASFLYPALKTSLAGAHDHGGADSDGDSITLEPDHEHTFSTAGASVIRQTVAMHGVRLLTAGQTLDFRCTAYAGAGTVADYAILSGCATIRPAGRGDGTGAYIP